MQPPLHSQRRGLNGLVSVLLFIVVQANAATLSTMQDTVGAELVTRVDATASLGELEDEGADVDAPEQLELTAPPKAHALTAEEVALVQSKVSHKDEVSHKKMKRLRVQRTHDIELVQDQDENQETPRHDESKTQATLAKTWVKANQDQAKSADDDVEQLGGQLQNIMSEVEAPVAEEKEQNNGKQVLDQAAQMEEAADSGDDAAMEKEAAEETQSADSQKDDAENVVDGAMAYIRTRLANEEHKSMRLRQLLSQSVRGNHQMRDRIAQLRKDLAAGAVLQKSLRATASTKVTKEEAEVASVRQHQELTTQELKNATNAAKIGEKTVKVLGMKLKYAKSQVAALLLNLANTSQQNKELRRKLESTNATAVSEASLLKDGSKIVSAQEKELSKVKHELQQLKAAKTAEDKQLKELDRKNDMMQQHAQSDGKRGQILHKENGLLKKQLATEIQRAEQLREMWTKESEAFTWQLRAERANASESLSDLEKARTEFRDLRERVKKLRDRASHGEESRHAAEDAANKAQFALAEAQSENQQLKGSVPFLQAEVNREHSVVQNVTKQAQQAMKERDTVKAILGEAQKSIVQLQGQYADALQALVVAQAAGPDASKQQPANNMQEFAGVGDNPLGSPPPTAPIDFAQAPDGGGSSLLELGRDEKALDTIVSTPQVSEADHTRVDLSKDSGGLSTLLRGMKGAR